MDGDRSTETGVSRRRLLQAVAGGGTAALAGCSLLERESDATATTIEDDRATALAERFAPRLSFDRYERWFPTDPRQYEHEEDGETVVDGFDAFDGYTKQFEAGGEPPAPTVFYHAVEYEESPLAVVQFWFYSVFDQFTTNFHWHDWELLQVFVDTETDEPQLYVASAHSRKVPNNEHLDPQQRPRILAELGSHSSTVSLNERPESFQRLPVGDVAADITNRGLEALESLSQLPIAYGLPRDEGGRLPYVVPELDGAPIYEHDRLPSVDRESLVDDAVTIRSYDALSSPPGSIPAREPGLTMEHAGREDTGADATYDLVPTTEAEHISAFTGPQLSFEFAIPGFVEDAVAGHITTAGVPWDQTRYANPAADISEPAHRATLADRYDAIGAPSAVNSVIATVSRTISSDEAPDGQGVTTAESPVETMALLESEPEAVPTFRGVAMVQDVPAGEHRLTVNGAGFEPHSEPVGVEDGGSTAVAGVEGEIPLVASEDAVKLRVDADGTDADLTDVSVADDFGGRLYEASMDGPDAVYVHRGGAYTTEVRDSDDAIGAFRVRPGTGAGDGDSDDSDGDDSEVTIERPDTGKASLSRFLADISAETATDVDRATGADDDGRPSSVNGLVQALEAISEAADRAAKRAAETDSKGADRALEAVTESLERASQRLAEAREDVPAPTAKASEKRLAQADRRAEQALASEKL
ncbi:hypothetical protein [Haloarchaeobius amylolyticus]|uniref:hypothetical protein n=1 Tax=Haloarchaeobius amylolyticus TaxID=1198296 RepID=UPI0022702E6E|nr:hypothetical protein [Haloarchaeobius amylolyticus]